MYYLNAFNMYITGEAPFSAYLIILQVENSSQNLGM